MSDTPSSENRGREGNDAAHQAAVNLHSGFGTLDDLAVLVEATRQRAKDENFDLDEARGRYLAAEDDETREAIQAEIAEAIGDSHTWQSAIRYALTHLNPTDPEVWEWALDHGHADLAAESRYTPFARLVRLGCMNGPAAKAARRTLVGGGGQGIDEGAWQLAGEMADGGSSVEEIRDVLAALYDVEL